LAVLWTNRVSMTSMLRRFMLKGLVGETKDSGYEKGFRYHVLEERLAPWARRISDGDNKNRFK
jgi:hypothetical protein